MANVRFIKNTIYNLKKDFGEWMDLYITGKSTVDLRTGTQTILKKVLQIKCVNISQVTLAQIAHLFPMLVGTKHTAYAPTTDKNTALIVIEQSDLPKGTELTTSCFVVLNRQKYQIQKIESSEHDLMYVATLVRINSQVNFEIHELHAESRLLYQQIAGSE